MEPIPLNHIAGELLRAVERIVDGSRNFGEVSAAHLHRRHAKELTRQPALFVPLVVRHEKEPVRSLKDMGQPNGAAKGEPVLVPLEGILRPLAGERVLSRVQLVVAEELEQGSMELVRSRLRRNIDLRGGPSELGGEDPRLHLELLQRID